MKPKVSVFLLTYNHEPYIRAALEGVFAQEREFPIEVVVHDDVSMDGTRQIVDEFVARYPDRMRVTYRNRDIQHGDLRSILDALEMCRGDYIALIDGDDCWIDTSKLQRQVDFLEAHPAYWLCFHNCRVEYGNRRRRSWELIDHRLPDTITTDDFLQTSLVQTSTIVIRPGLIPLLRQWPQLLNDWFIGITASRLGPVGYIDRTMSIYRQTEGGGWSARTRADQWALSVVRCAALHEVLGPEYREKIERAICTRSYMAAIEYERQRDYSKARTHLARALQGKPEWLEPYCARYGVTGALLMRRLSGRLRLYRMSALMPFWFALERLIEELRWRWLRAGTKFRSHMRLRRGDAVGHLRVSPNPARCSPRSSGLSAVDLEWSSEGTRAVEVRVGSPDGVLLSHTAPSGKAKTGDWVADGMVFYLQDVFDKPLTARNTLDVVRVRVEGY